MTVVKQSQIEGTFKLGLSNVGADISALEQSAKVDNEKAFSAVTGDIPIAEQQLATEDVPSDSSYSLKQQAYDEGYLHGENAAKSQLEADYQARLAELTLQAEELTALKARYNNDLSELSSTLATIQQQISSLNEALAQRSVEIATYAIRDLLQQHLLNQDNIIRLITDVVAANGLTPDCRLYAGKQIQPLLLEHLEWEVVKDLNLADFEVEFRQSSCHRSIDLERYFDDLKAAFRSLMVGGNNE